MNRPASIAFVRKGQALAAVEHLRDSLNWVFGWVANLRPGDGIRIDGRDTDHPTIRANIVAGDGITLLTSNGQIKIAVTDKLPKDDGKPKSVPTAGGGGHGGSSGSGSSGGSGGGAGADGASGISGGGSSGGSASGDSDGNNCNQWSGGVDNGGSADLGMDNNGDNCAELNGW